MEQIEKDGQKIDVFTAEEVETQKKAAIEEATKPLQEQFAQAQEALKKFEGKDFNFGELRSQKEAAEKLAAELKAQIEGVPKAIEEKFAEKENATKVETLASKLAEGDAKLQKKILHHFTETLKGVEAKDEAAMAAKMRNAYTLATKNESVPDALASVLSSSGAGGMAPVAPAESTVPKPLADLTKKVAAAGGIVITDDDIKKYGK